MLMKLRPKKKKKIEETLRCVFRINTVKMIFHSK